MMDLRNLLEKAFADATKTAVANTALKQLHVARARAWITSLTTRFRCQYCGNSMRVLSKYNATHRKEFGLNELLYDVLVCQVDIVEKYGKPLVYIQDVVWQVESEFARDRRQALYDFNKLVLGAGHNKLFIGPQVSDYHRYIDTLLPAADRCTGNVYLALIPHPRDWNAVVQKIDIWQYNNGSWASLV
jgi:hypothetical protein